MRFSDTIPNPHFSMEEYITPSGLSQLKKELADLKNVKRWEIARWLREASTQGDLDENSEYIAAKEAQTALESKIEELEELIRSAKVIKHRRKDVVDIGSRVEFLASGNTKMKVRLVSSEEADAGKGKISPHSPLGKALLGRKAGEDIDVVTPKGRKKYRITRII